MFRPEKVAAAPYNQGKTITIVVGTNPGRGYDNTARLVARHLSQYIPGKPTIFTENNPGAGHAIATNYIYNLAKADGTVIGTYQGLPFAQLSKTQGVKYDIMKYVWTGSMAVDPTALFIRTDLPYKTAEDLKKAKSPIICASEKLGTSGYQFPFLLKEFAAGSDFATDKKGKTIIPMLSSVDRMSRPFVLPPYTVRCRENPQGCLCQVGKRHSSERRKPHDEQGHLVCVGR